MHIPNEDRDTMFYVIGKLEGISECLGDKTASTAINDCVDLLNDMMTSLTEAEKKQADAQPGRW